MNDSQIIHVYFIPGLAANSSIFEFIELPKDKFEIHLLDWMIPTPGETLKEYALRMTKFIKHDNVVLLGVSFGGVVVQEMAQFLNLKRLIIVSSVYCQSELPRRMRYASKAKLL